MSKLVYGLGLLVLLCVGLRALAWLVTPALPVLLELFITALVLQLLVPFARR